MTRPKKQVVDYFPHTCRSGRTIYILESRFGNDGYAFWFKLLEILGESEGHFLDCSAEANWQYLLAKTQTGPDKANEIISTLIGLGKIDAQLWQDRKVIWIENFVINLSGLYQMRHTELPKKPSLIEETNVEEVGISPKETPRGDSFLKENAEGVGVSPKETPRGDISSKVKESKVKESKYPYQDIAAMWNVICGENAGLPKVKALGESRKQKIRCRLDEFLETAIGAEDKVTAWIDMARKIFSKVAASDFLRGQNKSGWRASFDWVFDNGKNWVKVIEGNYDGKVVLPKGTLQLKLGIGEFIDDTGRRTYGTGRVTIPQDAPARPSERHSWSAETGTWILL